MIDIIIPAYNAHSTINRTLLSICYQTISDKLSVYIVNDKSDEDYKEFVDKYKKYINIKEITLEKNSGPGIAREEGIKNSSSPYIVFIDSDDTFASPKALDILLTTIEKKACDMVVGNFVEDTSVEYVHHDYDTVWLHGKIFRRSYLEEHNIHFNDTRADEDNYFIKCLLLSGIYYENVNYPIYFWDYNPNSITRKNNYEYKYKSFCIYIDNMSSALKYAVENNCNESLIAHYSYAVLRVIYYYYLEYEDEEYLKVSKYIKKVYLDYKDKLEDKRIVEENQYNEAIHCFTEDKIVNPKYTFDDFMNKVGD